MAKIVKARAYANNEVAFIAWETDQVTIPGCLGFDIVRELLDAPGGQVIETKSLPAYVAFKDQANPDWRPQTTAVWPVQKYNWRDLTLRRRRDQLGTRPENEVVRYRIRAVGRYKPSLDEVFPEITQHKDAQGNWIPNTYEGAPLKLGYLTPPALTNEVTTTRKRGSFLSTFTNGILSTQFLVRVLKEDGKIEDGELKKHLTDPGDSLRRYLAGDVMSTIREFLTRTSGTFHAALYELEDEELLDLLVAAAPRIKLILSDSGGKSPVFDTRNAYARSVLRAVANKPGSTFALQDRLFNGSGHIGHNKFVIWSDAAGVPQAVLTGSTNWTWSGVCGQSNNLVVIEDLNVAEAFMAYWQRLHSNPLPQPVPTSAANSGADQGDTIKTLDRSPNVVSLAGGGSAEIWFSPNMPEKKSPPAASVTPKPEHVPPDMARLFSLMRRANSMIMFAVFYPSKAGRNSIIGEAINLGLTAPALKIVGAISDAQSWGHRGDTDQTGGVRINGNSPFIIREGGINVVRATALTDKDVGKELGDFVTEEILTAGKAIIHDKILVIDPLDPVNCVVAFGSHNLGYRASYANDENLVIVKGVPELAQAYAVHVLDVYDHYRFRVAEADAAAERVKKGLPKVDKKKGGFLSRSGSWQARAYRGITEYFAG